MQAQACNTHLSLQDGSSHRPLHKGNRPFWWQGEECPSISLRVGPRAASPRLKPAGIRTRAAETEAWGRGPAWPARAPDVPGARAPAGVGTARGAGKHVWLAAAATHHDEPRPWRASSAWRREAQGQGPVRAGQAGSARPRRRAPSAGARHAGHSHHLQHERAQVRGGSLQPAQRIRRRPVWAGKGMALGRLAGLKPPGEAGRPAASTRMRERRRGGVAARVAPPPARWVVGPCRAASWKCSRPALLFFSSTAAPT